MVSMRLSVNLICGGLMSQNLKINSKSEEFVNFVKRVDQILSGTETTTATGQPIEYGDDHFQDRMKRLQQTHFAFEDGPVYPLSIDASCALVWDEIKAKQDEQDNGL